MLERNQLSGVGGMSNSAHVSRGVRELKRLDCFVNYDRDEAKNHSVECERAQCLQEKVADQGSFKRMESGYCVSD